MALFNKVDEEGVSIQEMQWGCMRLTLENGDEFMTLYVYMYYICAVVYEYGDLFPYFNGGFI